MKRVFVQDEKKNTIIILSNSDAQEFFEQVVVYSASFNPVAVPDKKGILLMEANQSINLSVQGDNVIIPLKKGWFVEYSITP